jgi:hypothetical protein
MTMNVISQLLLIVCLTTTITTTMAYRVLNFTIVDKIPVYQPFCLQGMFWKGKQSTQRCVIFVVLNEIIVKMDISMNLMVDMEMEHWLKQI